MISMRIRRHLGLALAGLLFVSTAGIPVHKVICLCQGQQMVSLFADEDLSCCSHQETIEPETCCSKRQSVCTRGSEEEGGSCQDSQTTIARISGQFLTSVLADETADFSSSIMVPAIGFSQLVQEHLPETHGTPPPSVPILLSGTSLFLRHCQIRC